VKATDEIVRRAKRAAGEGAAGIPARPAMRVTILTCMDARIDPARLFGLELGDAHILRNAGGVVTEDVIRSVMLSQRLLGTTEVLLIHHTRCGMQGLTEAATKAEIEAETGIRPPFALEAFDDIDADVRQSMARIRSSPFLRQGGSVRGFVYDLADGTLREVL
jgi:carbonic anhydrase